MARIGLVSARPEVCERALKHRQRARWIGEAYDADNLVWTLEAHRQARALQPKPGYARKIEDLRRGLGPVQREQPLMGQQIVEIHPLASAQHSPVLDDGGDRNRNRNQRNHDHDELVMLQLRDHLAKEGWVYGERDRTDRNEYKA